MRKYVLVRAISQKPLFRISPNLVCMCVLPSFQHLLTVSDLDLHLQGHLALKHSKSGYFGLVRTISPILGILTQLGCAYRKHEGALIGGFTCRTGSVGGAYFIA